jgi:hypothetical protein
VLSDICESVEASRYHDTDKILYLLCNSISLYLNLEILTLQVVFRVKQKMAETTIQPTTPEQHSNEQFLDTSSQDNKYSQQQQEKLPSNSNLSQQQVYQQQIQSHVASQFTPEQNPQAQSQPPPPGQVQIQPPPPGLSTPQQLLTRPPEFIANKIDATPPPQFHVIQASSSSSTTLKGETLISKSEVVTSIAPPTPTSQVSTPKKPFSKKPLQPIYLLLRKCLKEVKKEFFFF